MTATTQPATPTTSRVPQSALDELEAIAARVATLAEVISADDDRTGGDDRAYGLGLLLQDQADRLRALGNALATGAEVTR